MQTVVNVAHEAVVDRCMVRGAGFHSSALNDLLTSGFATAISLRLPSSNQSVSGYPC